MIEYSSEYVQSARDIEGVNVQQGNPECAETVIKGAPFDAFTSFSYPAKLIDPNAMLQCVYKNTTNDAVGLIVVPSLEHLLSASGFFDVTIDHAAYYDASSLKFLLQKNGFEVLEIGEEAGVYNYAYVRKRKKYDLANTWLGVETMITKVASFVANEKKQGRKIAAWCAGHFAFTVLALIKNRDEVDYIIDNASFKQGKYAPASHIPIHGPENFATCPVDTIMILGPMYTQEIITDIREKCSSDVKIVIVNKNGLEMVGNEAGDI